MMKILITLSLLLSSGCASGWKVHGGPSECKQMCKNWDLEFAAMVGVGSQSRTGDGASACVCQPKEILHKVSTSKAGAATSTSSLAGPIVSAQAAQAAAASAQAAAAMTVMQMNAAAGAQR